MVATSDAHYLTQDDYLAHDVLLCINTGKTIDQPLDKPRFVADDGKLSDQFHVRSPEEMYSFLPGMDEALAISARIAGGIEENYGSLGLGKRQFPSFQAPEAKTAEEYLQELCEQGLRERYGDPPPSSAQERLDHELGVIKRMGFASYFLIVWDFVRYARERGIPASARGSACGTLVSYVLHLSNVCPIKYDLLFERFLDPNRSEAPDIDIDLCQERRYEVIDYVRKKYGDANVAQIGTFGTMKAKAAIKDVGRVLSIPLARVEQINRLIPTRLNITLEDALKEEPALRSMVEQDPEIERLIRFAQRLEGSAKRQHARRGRGDRRPAARVLGSASGHPPGRQGRDRLHPVGHGRRREGRAAQDGLPRPAQPDHPGGGRTDHQRAPSRGACRHRPASHGRPVGLRASCSAARPRASSSSRARAFATCWSR